MPIGTMLQSLGGTRQTNSTASPSRVSPLGRPESDPPEVEGGIQPRPNQKTHMIKKLNPLIMVKKLNSLIMVPFEQWRSHGISLRAVSANADGMVHSGITSTGVYFFRKWTGGTSEFVLG
jgi:hypothetical protein